ncbi:hypothetical protein H1R20_g6817, partial [Candolleomyces eurysporus]
MVSPSAPTPPPAIPMTLEQQHQTETRQGNVPSDNPPGVRLCGRTAFQLPKDPYDKVKPQIPSSLDQSEPLIPYNYGGPAYGRQPTFTPSPTVYYYNNPVNGGEDNIPATSIPPRDGMLAGRRACATDELRDPGVIGILAAIFWFPLGIGLCLIDKKVKCSRCGITIDEGVCG